MLSANLGRMLPEALQTELMDYLERIDWTGDSERIAQRLAQKHSCGSHVVGFRRRGKEVLLHHHDRNTLTAHEITPSGQVLQVGTVWRRRSLEEWLERHYHYLEWVNPDYRARDEIRP